MRKADRIRLTAGHAGGSSWPARMCVVTQATLQADRRRAGVFDWWRAADARAHRAFVAAALGWMLDAFDVMLYSMVVAALIQDPQLHLSLPGAGILNSVTLVSAAVGGIFFGIVADRFGRKRALMASVLLY